MRYKGNAASEGIAIGRVLQYRAYTAKVEKKERDFLLLPVPVQAWVPH